MTPPCIFSIGQKILLKRTKLMHKFSHYLYILYKIYV